jgi:hypothetical protein
LPHGVEGDSRVRPTRTELRRRKRHGFGLRAAQLAKAFDEGRWRCLEGKALARIGCEIEDQWRVVGDAMRILSVRTSVTKCAFKRPSRTA